MSKFGFISGLEDKKEPKQKFQLFEAEVGFEHIQVCIPFDNADLFTEEATKTKPKTKTVLNKLAQKYGGELI